MRRIATLLILLSALVPSFLSAQQTGAVQSDARAYDPAAPVEPGYDPALDPNHPLRGQDDPGEAWDGPHRRADGTPNITVLSGDWDWGELEYDRTYQTSLVVVNECDWQQEVTIEVDNLPYLSINRRARIPADSETPIPATIRTPAAPSAPIISGTQPFHAGGLFLDIHDGAVRVWHPWSVASGKACQPKRVAWTVTGHIHFPPDGGGGASGPSRIASPHPCTVYWNTGERPANAEEDCTEKIRVLALHYRERVLQVHAGTNPAAWEWLPGRPEIQGMPTGDLFAMRDRAEEQIHE
jgi:hypothetical protein